MSRAVQILKFRIFGRLIRQVGGPCMPLANISQVGRSQVDQIKLLDHERNRSSGRAKFLPFDLGPERCV